MSKFSMNWIKAIIKQRHPNAKIKLPPQPTYFKWGKKNSKQLDFMLYVRETFGISLDEQIPNNL
jgi:hypothetical protein